MVLALYRGLHYNSIMKINKEVYKAYLTFISKNKLTTKQQELVYALLGETYFQGMIDGMLEAQKIYKA